MVETGDRLAGPRQWAGQASLYVLLAALLLVTLWNGGYFPTSKWVFSLLLLTAGAVELAASTMLEDLSLPRTPLFWLLAAFTVFSTASLLWSVSASDTQREAVLLFGLLAAMFTVHSQLRRSGGRALGLIAAWLVYCGGFVSAWGLITYIYRIAPYSGEVDGFLRAGSSFEYSNALSCFGLMALPVTVILHRRANPRDRPLLALALSLETAAVLLSYARFGYVVLLLLTAFFLLSGRKHRTVPAIVLALVAGMAAAVAAAFMEEAAFPTIGLMAVVAILGCAWVGQLLLERTKHPASRRTHLAITAAAALAGLAAAVTLLLRAGRLREIISARFGQGMSPGSLLPHRLDTYSGAVDAYRVHPVAGSGLGTFAQSYQQYAIAAYTRFAHNLVLQTAVDTGLIGAALMAAFLLYVAALCVWRLASRSDHLVRAFAAAALIFICYNMFDWEWYVPALAGWFVVVVMIVASSRRETPR